MSFDQVRWVQTHLTPEVAGRGRVETRLTQGSVRWVLTHPPAKGTPR